MTFASVSPTVPIFGHEKFKVGNTGPDIYLVSNPEAADFINKGVTSSVNRKCPKWFVPSCISKPSSVFHSGHIIMPAKEKFLLGYDEQKKWSVATVEIPTDALFQIGKSAAAFQRHNKVWKKFIEYYCNIGFTAHNIS